MKKDEDVKKDTGVDKVCVRFFGEKKTVKEFSYLQDLPTESFLRIFWSGSFNARSWLDLDRLENFEERNGEVRLTFVYRDNPSDGYCSFFHCTNPTNMRNIALTGFRNSQDVELKVSP